jgi:hypothetical protein
MKTKKRPRKVSPAIEKTIVQTTYMVTIIAAKGTPETNLWIGRHFTPTINRAINAAIQKAAARAVAHYVRCGKLDKSFRIEDRKVWTVDEWRVQVNVRVSQATRTEFEQAALVERRTLANFAKVILEWGFEQFKMAGSTERLLQYKIRPATTGNKTTAAKSAASSDRSSVGG